MTMSLIHITLTVMVTTVISIMLVSPALVHNQQSVVIHVEDHNASDHYAISTVVNMDSKYTTKKQYVKNKTLKYMWNKGDVNVYANVVSKELSNIIFPKNCYDV